MFYQTLGIDFAEEKRGNGPVHFAGRVGGVVIEVYPLTDGGSPVDSSTRLGFSVENVAEVVQVLQGIGTKIVAPARELRLRPIDLITARVYGDVYMELRQRGRVSL
jgi:hypothetical protein